MRIRDGKDKDAYFHEYFLRGRPDLTVSIRRICLTHQQSMVNSRRRRVLSSRQSTLDLYRFPICYELTSSQVKILAGRAKELDTSVQSERGSEWTTRSSLSASAKPPRSSTVQDEATTMNQQQRKQPATQSSVFEMTLQRAAGIIESSAGVDSLRRFPFDETVGAVGEPHGEGLFRVMASSSTGRRIWKLTQDDGCNRGEWINLKEAHKW